MADEAFERSARADLGHLGIYVVLIRGAVQVAAGRVAASRGSVLAGLRFVREQQDATKPLSDGLHVIAAYAAIAGSDEECARLIGAAKAIRADLGLGPEALTNSRIGRLTRSAEQRLGKDAWRMNSAAGATDPMGVLDRLLMDAEPSTTTRGA